MKNVVCPFTAKVNKTYYPSGNLKAITMAMDDPLRKLATIGLTKAATSAA